MFRALFLLISAVIVICSCGKEDKEPVVTPTPVYTNLIDTTIGVYGGNVVFTYRRIEGDSLNESISDSGGVYPDTIVISKVDATHFMLTMPDGFKFDKDSPTTFAYNPTNIYIKTRMSTPNGNDTLRLLYFAPDSISIETRIGASATASERWSRHYHFMGSK